MDGWQIWAGLILFIGLLLLFPPLRRLLVVLVAIVALLEWLASRAVHDIVGDD
jgi:hypothetical protein